MFSFILNRIIPVVIEETYTACTSIISFLCRDDFFHLKTLNISYRICYLLLYCTLTYTHDINNKLFLKQIIFISIFKLPEPYNLLKICNVFHFEYSPRQRIFVDNSVHHTCHLTTYVTEIIYFKYIHIYIFHTGILLHYYIDIYFIQE